ncbi:Centromere/kinetochore Zw10-domain-containing protein [Parasitella parasitica]|nr:Centromere/kinetochore Zw10-domain-containing protein [Parasitella parasitica]
MPPIRQLDDAFLSSLLEKQVYPELKSNIDSESLVSILKKLNSASDALQQELFEQVHSNFDDFSAGYNSSQELHSRVLDLVRQTSHTQQQLTTTQTHVEQTVERYQHVLEESHRNKSKIDVLEHIEQVLQIMESIDAELGQYNYVDAAQHVLQLAATLNEWRNADARVIQMINERIQQLKQSLVLGLQDGIHTAIKYNPGSIRILETYQPSTASNKQVHTRDVLQSLYQLGLLPEELMAVQRSIFNNIFGFYFQRTSCTLQIDSVQVENEGSGGVLQVIPAADSDNEGHVDPVLMLQHMEAIFGFIYRYAFGSTDAAPNDREMKLLFGNLFLPDLSDLMIAQSIAPAVPSSKYNLAEFDRVAQAVNQFESHCRDIYGFQVQDAALGLYVKNIDLHYAKKRRNRILLEGRKVMMRRLYDTDMVSVKEDDGHTYHYQITQTPQLLSVLVSDTLSEGSDMLKSHPISASTLTDGIQDLLDMYRSIMPSFHRSQYLASACNSLVFRNDCLWLANQLATTTALKPEASLFPQLKAGLGETAKRLRQLGKTWHELTMMQRAQQIQSVLDALDGFSGMAENLKFQQDCDRAIARVLELVGSFAAETRPVIDETLFLDMLGRIADSVLARLISDIEELVDIGAEESHIIARALNSLAQLVNAFDLPGRDATEGFVADLVPSWQKFWLVKDILEMNMREIMESFRCGDLHMFEKSELVGLLCSLFADTELRESNIQEIKTGISPSQPYPNAGQRAREAVAAAPVQPQHSPSPTAARTHATLSTPHSTLEYTPGDDETIEESGWGDDDDIDFFADDGLGKDNPVSQTSLEPSPNLDYDVDIMVDDTVTIEAEGGGGWGDADEDIFDNDALLVKKDVAGDECIADPAAKKDNNQETACRASRTSLPISGISSPTLSNISATTSMGNTTTAIGTTDTATGATNAATLLSAPALNLDAEDGEGWGWNDQDDDDLFKA